MTLVDKYGPLMLRIALDARAHARGRRGGRAGGVARRPPGPGPLRGPLQPEDLDPADRRQPRAHARGAGGAQRAAVLAGAGRGRGRARRRPGPLPAAPTTRATRAAGRCRRTAGRACPRSSCSPPRRCSRSAPRSPSCRRASRRSSSCATSRAGSPRRSREALELTPGNQRVLLHRARCEGPRRARALLRGVAAVSGPIIPGGITCREVVELVTAYLDGALDARRPGGWRPTSSSARRAPSTSSRSARPPASPRSPPRSSSCGPTATPS